MCIYRIFIASSAEFEVTNDEDDKSDETQMPKNDFLVSNYFNDVKLLKSLGFGVGASSSDADNDENSSK